MICEAPRWIQNEQSFREAVRRKSYRAIFEDD
jgi:hypothetical protein